MASEETITEIKGLLETFLLDEKKRDNERWKRFEDHCREDMKHVYEVQERQGKQITEHGTEIKQIKGQLCVKPHENLFRAKIVEIVILVAAIVAGIYFGRHIP